MSSNKDSRKIRWMDGTVEESLPGKLLSDNIGFYGDLILTGMTYEYLTPLAGDADTSRDVVTELVGRRLLDGNLHGRYRKMVPQAQGDRMVVQFDLHQDCTVTEFDLVARCKVDCIYIEISQDGTTFSEAYERHEPKECALYRCELTDAPQCRYLRLTLIGSAPLTLWQVWIWGDTLRREEEAAADGAIHFEWANSISMESLPGIPQTAFSDMEGFRWSKNLRKNGIDLPVVWSCQPAYGSLSTQPILPTPEQVNQPVSVRLCRNGVEAVCLALTNTDTSRSVDVLVELDDNTPLRAELFAGGVMPTRWYGTTVGPLLNQQVTINRELLSCYLTNGMVVCDFPRLHLPAGGSCIIWLKLFGNDAAPGDYELKLRAGDAVVSVRADVLPVQLEEEHAGIWLWSNESGHTPYAGMVPFVYDDRAVQEAAYRNEIGTNVYWDWPEPGTVADEARKKNANTYFMIHGLGGYEHRLYTGALKAEDITAQVEQEMEAVLAGHLAAAQKYGVDNDHWFLEMPDEPGAHNAKALGVMVRLCKRLHPEVRIYVNPSFWAGFDKDAVAEDDVIEACLKDWYKLIDVSMPLVLNLDDRPKAWEYFSHPRFFNGQYCVSSQHMGADRAELLHLPREAAWDSLARDMNWWGFYSYHEPRLNSWDNTMCPGLHEDGTINYQCVYSGVNGPVPTRASELIREGWQDYRIMQQLRRVDPALYTTLQQEYLAGNRDFDALKAQALDRLVAE